MKPRIGTVNSDHLWYGVNNGENAALDDYAESGLEESTVVKVVKLDQYQTIMSSLERQLLDVIYFIDSKEMTETGTAVRNNLAQIIQKMKE